MSLVFAAITPHPPILIPTVGKEHAAKSKATLTAMERLEQDLYSAKPDIVLIISPHGELNPSAFTVNLCQEFSVKFESFGDFATKLKFPGDMVMFTAGKEMISSRAPINIISNPELDHGCGVPLYFLARHLADARIIPIYFSMLDNQAHFDFGKALKDLILNSDKRVAVIASGDLSHCLSDESPAKCNPDGKIFDEKIIDLIVGCDLLSLVNIDHKLVENAAECGLRSILILAGILSDMKCKPIVLSYEAPYGVGYLVSEVIL